MIYNLKKNQLAVLFGKKSLTSLNLCALNFKKKNMVLSLGAEEMYQWLREHYIL